MPTNHITSTDPIRIAFERHIAETCNVDLHIFHRNSDGTYWNTLVKDKWTVWNAAIEFSNIQRREARKLAAQYKQEKYDG